MIPTRPRPIDVLVLANIVKPVYFWTECRARCPPSRARSELISDRRMTTWFCVGLQHEQSETFDKFPFRCFGAAPRFFRTAADHVEQVGRIFGQLRPSLPDRPNQQLQDVFEAAFDL